MNVNSKRLAGVPVRTVSGALLGKLVSLDFEAETGRLAALHVQMSGVVPALLGREALVSWSQVVEITESQVTVADATVREVSGSPLTLPAGT